MHKLLIIPQKMRICSLVVALLLSLGAARLHAPLTSTSSLNPPRFQGSGMDWLLVDGGGSMKFVGGYNKVFWATVCTDVTKYIDEAIEAKGANFLQKKPQLYYKTKLLNSFSVLVEDLYSKKKVNDESCSSQSGWWASNKASLDLGPRCDCIVEQRITQ